MNETKETLPTQGSTLLHYFFEIDIQRNVTIYEVA